MFAILSLGFAVGLQHAFEADHLAAVASLSARSKHVRDVVVHGLTWGLGHALTLVLLAGGVFVAGSVIPEAWAGRLEFCVGVMLVGLGLVLRVEAPPCDQRQLLEELGQRLPLAVALHAMARRAQQRRGGFRFADQGADLSAREGKRRGHACHPR